MGLFDKFKKKNVAADAAQAKTPEMEAPAAEAPQEEEAALQFNVTDCFGGIMYDGQIEDAFEFDMENEKFRMANDDMFFFIEEIAAYFIMVAFKDGNISNSLDDIENEEDVASIYVCLRMSYTAENKFMASFYESYDDSKTVAEAVEKANECIEFLKKIGLSALVQW